MKYALETRSSMHSLNNSFFNPDLNKKFSQKYTISRLIN